MMPDQRTKKDPPGVDAGHEQHLGAPVAAALDVLRAEVAGRGADQGVFCHRLLFHGAALLLLCACMQVSAQVQCAHINLQGCLMHLKSVCGPGSQSRTDLTAAQTCITWACGGVVPQLRPLPLFCAVSQLAICCRYDGLNTLMTFSATWWVSGRP